MTILLYCRVNEVSLQMIFPAAAAVAAAVAAAGVAAAADADDDDNDVPSSFSFSRCIYRGTLQSLKTSSFHRVQ